MASPNNGQDTLLPKPTQFPSGILPCIACQDLATGVASRQTVAEGRARDASFVIDELTNRHPAWSFASIIDRRRIGMAGHSIGGDATAATMEADRRVLAGVNIDWTVHSTHPRIGSQPSAVPDAGRRRCGGSRH